MLNEISLPKDMVNLLCAYQSDVCDVKGRHNRLTHLRLRLVRL